MAAEFQPGERYAYSNTNYHLLAMILRKHSGKFYGEESQGADLSPLETNDTRIVSWSDLIPNRAAGYEWNGPRDNGDFVAELILGYGGGGIVSTVADMAKWAASQEERNFSPKPCTSRPGPAKSNDGNISGYGLGWGDEDQRASRRWAFR